MTDGEMAQIMGQIAKLRTPLNLNGFINGGTVQIIRDNENDTHNFKKTISLKIFDRNEIAAGRTRYQIAQQPKFKAKNSIYPNRRGDFCLLINGMPVIHVELKKATYLSVKHSIRFVNISTKVCLRGCFHLCRCLLQ